MDTQDTASSDPGPLQGPSDAPPRRFSGAHSSTSSPQYTTPKAAVGCRDTDLLDELRVPLVDAFFKSIYALPSYAFLHPQTTKRRCRDDRPHRSLTFAVCAIAAFHLGSVHGTHITHETTSTWIQTAEQNLWMHLESPTIPRLQALLLVIHHHMETSRFQRAFMLTATASQFAAAMRLNHEHTDLDFIAREVRRRIIWSLKIIERYFSVGLAEFDPLPLEIIYVDYPSSEEEFMALHHITDERERDAATCEQVESMAVGSQPAEGGAYSLLVRLEVVRRDIMRLTRSVAPLDEPLPSLLELIRHHDNTLSSIGAPTPLPGDDGGLDPAQDKWLPRHVLAHISWHQAHCDLYRTLLKGYPEAAPAVVIEAIDPDAVVNAEKQCVFHAARIIRIITDLNQQSTRRPLLEFDTAICVYHATRLMLFISRFGRSRDRPTGEYAASRAELSLAALKRFFPTSPLAAPIIKELEASLQVFSLQERQSRLPQAEAMSQAAQRVGATSVVSTSPEKVSPSSPQQIEPHQKGPRKRLLSATARARQQLAVHSLLRQAAFSDHDGEGEDESDEAVDSASGPSPSAAPVANSPPNQERMTAASPSSHGGNSSRKLSSARTKSTLDPTVNSLSSNGNIDQRAKSISSPSVDIHPSSEWESHWSPGSFLPAGQLTAVTPAAADAQSDLFSFCGPHNWEWLFDPEQQPIQS
ncbi:hypothetical protein K4F52_002392 [Lecanicillium sp. MT-2017a]|nr:hypothetical protein K4F52_002392 [Lecanicillium sp. MT-2017a]